MASYGIAMQLDVKVPMRDGVRLSADIYLPHGAPPVPAVLIRTPYSNNSDGLIEQGRRLRQRHSHAIGRHGGASRFRCRVYSACATAAA